MRRILPALGALLLFGGTSCSSESQAAGIVGVYDATQTLQAGNTAILRYWFSADGKGAIFFAYILAAIARGLLVGLGVYLVTVIFFDVPLQLPLLALLFGILGSGILGAMGLIAGIWADKFDQLAAFQNFIILPLTFLSGVFYSVHSLPAGWQVISHLNPFFYMIDGFRYGFFGVSDISPYVSLGIMAICLIVISTFTIRLLRSGYKLRH